MVDYVILGGKTKWFHAVRPDTKFGEPKWKHVLYFNEASLKKFRELQDQGLMNHLKKDDEGYFASLSRKCHRTYKGKLTPQDPPLVVDKDGSPLHDTNVGNGSDVTTKLRIYKFKSKTNPQKMIPAIEWVASRIDNLVPFVDSKDFTDEELATVKGLPEEPAPLF